MSYSIRNVFLSLSIFSVSAFAWELSESRKPELGVDGNPLLMEGRPLEETLKSPYVGRYQLDSKQFPLVDADFPANMQNPERKEERDQQKIHNEYFLNRLFSTEIQLKNAPWARYYVPDLQYDVIASDKDGKAVRDAQGKVVKQPGLRLIPVTSGDDEYRIPLAPTNFFGPGDPAEPLNYRERYPTVLAKLFQSEFENPAGRTYGKEFVLLVMTSIQKYQKDHSEAQILTDAQISAVMEKNKEVSVKTFEVENAAVQIAYGVKDDEKKTKPIHIITPHTTADEFFFDHIVGDPEGSRSEALAAPSSKPQTSIHHVTGFYRFAGVSKNSRRSMLSEDEPTNLRMVFTKNYNTDVKAEEAIKATQLNLALWFMLYYENSEGYAFADNYEFDDSYITNLEEVMEMARGWLDHKYVRKEFNATHASRLQKKMDKLMLPFNKIDADKSSSKELIEVASNNVWEMRSMVELLFGAKEVANLEKVQNELWALQRKIANNPNIHNLDEVRMTQAEKKNVKDFLDMLKKYQATTLDAAKKLPFYTLLQKDPALAEYCNEGVKDQTDKGINIPLTLEWLSRIYPKAQAALMFKETENELCKIQVLRANKKITALQKRALNSKACQVAATLRDADLANAEIAEKDKFIFTQLSDKEVQDTLNKMTPVFAQKGMVRDADRFDESNPLIPYRDSAGNPVHLLANGREVPLAGDERRDYDVRLIGNALAYGPQTTLDIIANLTKAYLPFHKSGASSAAVVVASFLAEHHFRTGVDTDKYVSYATSILREIYAGEGKLMRLKLAAAPADQFEMGWKSYTENIEKFLLGQFPKIMEGAIKASRENNEESRAPKVDTAKIAEKVNAAVQATLAEAKTLQVQSIAALGGPFGIYKDAMSRVDLIVDLANHAESTVLPNAIDAFYANKKRVKFYHQPGVNSLDHLGLVKRNPYVLIEDIGTAIDSRQVLSKDNSQEKQFVDQQLDNGLMHQEIVDFMATPVSDESLKNYQKTLYKNSLVGRPWSDAGAR